MQIYKKNTVRSYNAILPKFCDEFGDDNLAELNSDHILDFLSRITEGCKQQTKHLRFAHLSAFFNFIKINIDNDFKSPCDTPLLKKVFKAKSTSSWEIIGKDVIDEIISRTDNQRNRLMLELMARGGMRVGEVLKLTPADVNDRRLILRNPKSGKGREIVFIPQKVADRLKAQCH